MSNWTTLQKDIQLCKAMLLHRLRLFAGQSSEEPLLRFGKPVVRRSSYDQWLSGFSPTHAERLALVLALIPHVQNGFFEDCMLAVFPQGGDLPQMGGVKGINYRGMLPTGETVQFILAGSDLSGRLDVQQLLVNGKLAGQTILRLEAVKEGEPLMSGRLLLSPEWLRQLFTGEETTPAFGASFPARKVSSAMQWEDLVLNHTTQTQVQDLVLWMRHNAAVLNDPVLGRRIKPGYRVLFHGPSGTGKTLTATLLGKQFDKQVYRIDLSQVVSKYIGETEKNLERIFAKAEKKDWILFFDEADALFGKRTAIRDAHDKYANQEVSYLLQRVEDYPGLIILASNFKSNLDSAFLRRFNSIIYFPAPTAGERLQLWKKTWPSTHAPEPGIDLQSLSETFDLTGAAILNVVHDTLLHAVANRSSFLRKDDLLEAIRKEFRKEERSIKQLP